MSTIAYKLGGSLLDLPQLGSRLRDLLTRPLPSDWALRTGEPVQRLLVVGGGATAGIVRQWDAIHGLGEDASHRLALESMSLNARLIAELVPEIRLVHSRAEAQAAWRDRATVVLDAATFVDAEERQSDVLLQRCWDVTSDSVAAYVAVRWPADALILIKSIPRPTNPIATNSANGPVDVHFSSWATGLASLGWVNLRSSCAAVEPWRAV